MKTAGKQNRWRNELRDAENRLSTLWAEDDMDYRTALVLLHRTACRADEHVLVMFSDWTEEWLQAQAEDILLDLQKKGFGYRYDEADSEVDCLKRLSIHIRALELMISADSLGDYPADPNFDWLVPLGDEEFFLVPLPRRNWRKIDGLDKDTRTFTRRSLFMHRIIKAVQDGADVFFKPMREIRSPLAAVGFGAAIFPEVKFSETKEGGTFVVEAITAPQRDAVIEEGTGRAYRERCFSLVFPELTVDQSGRDLISSSLKLHSKTLSPEEGAAPTVVVAGSWHERDGDEYMNVSQVLDGIGNELLRYEKRQSFGGNGQDRERIRPGKTFPILLAPQGMVAFAICLDFCNRMFENLYGNLDVDFVLVTSCGNETTMSGHLATAETALIRHATVTFIAQQAYPLVPGTTGYVALRSKGGPPQAGTTAISGTWAAHFTETSFPAVDSLFTNPNVK